MKRLLRVLLVEDSPVTRKMLLTIILEQPNIVVETAGTLAEAVQKIKAGGINAVVLDLELPDAIGLHAFETVKSLKENLPIVVITGSDKVEFEQRAISGGSGGLHSEIHAYRAECGPRVSSRHPPRDSAA